MTISEYVRTATVSQARREIRAARDHMIALSPDEQLAFWQALHRSPMLTKAQVDLAATIRGEP